ncbi:YbgA family protein [Facklamia sp. 7083-14-GEN3]|uniref:YbgA family protein n=1 Tax=Facklamia sp. 7083-14-GEN3 TaxID=2973478 RepID=UPI00215B80CC|nr:YbgA family protein [Facklamia sp. 7083-14-GEN3]MCR8969363.1 YbgA family protein [Facklamia sp. 7083-14-GEN3]
MEGHKVQKRESQSLWSQNKYLVLSKSQRLYLEIREYLKNDHVDLAYVQKKIEIAEKLPENKKQSVNALLHIWGYFKKQANQQEKNGFFSRLDAYQQAKIEQNDVIEYIKYLLERYPNSYLQASTLINENK